MIFCLTGMHRSGTSLMSSYFNACGINMGERLVGAARGNERGHFEDNDIVGLHDEILSFNRSHMYSPSRRLDVPDYLADKARALLANKHDYPGPSGWKDPRTTLFLNFWADLDPGIFFVLLYREPLSVINSLRRRGTDRRITIMPWIPAQAWLRYNSEILSFHKNNPERSVIISITGFNKTHERSRTILGDKIGADLSRPYTDVFRREELDSTPHDIKRQAHGIFDRFYLGRLFSLHDELERVAAISSMGSRI